MRSLLAITNPLTKRLKPLTQQWKMFQLAHSKRLMVKAQQTRCLLSSWKKMKGPHKPKIKAQRQMVYGLTLLEFKSRINLRRNPQYQSNLVRAFKSPKTPGIYTSWNEANAAVKGISNVKHRKFKTLMQAKASANIYTNAMHTKKPTADLCFDSQQSSEDHKNRRNET